MLVIKKIVLLFSFAVLVAGPMVSVVAPQNTYAADAAPECEKALLGIHPWYRGLAIKNDGKCSIIAPGQKIDDKTITLQGFIWRIALNIIDIALALTAYIAFFFILYGGFQLLTGGDTVAKVEKARKTILNAAIGLVISIGAVALVNLIFRIIG